MKIKMSYIIVLLLVIALCFLLRDHIHFGGIEPAESLTIEYGEKLPSLKAFYSKDDTYATIKYYFNNVEVDTADFVGTYDVEITTGFNKTYKSVLYVQDTTPPVLVVKNLTINTGETYTAKDFVSSVSDLSHYTISFNNSDMGNYKRIGTYSILINASDDYNNVTTQKANLTIK